ncbi:acetylornithine/succinylornithine family transaminase [Neptuniibacter caesariensis]|uniref:Bifunctional N-succinyldiaminopimelate-aminotransferase/acetylornithine transaminase protein n=1 Tax=Neptuniibacter caesariensis TaxID=207954 RepID=A0A7U8GTK0_NEPCE|nr:acetylornithine/succinylornithine family transaminase [Neptuniibacter caesariensis]EAR62413.1 bifunctional N-succinyldiaminopimelate-aminotransferase/acetylornithine transaminase protein [Oceanospirillum sp. MED92] [Neptuniibacter caesariensis]
MNKSLLSVAEPPIENQTQHLMPITQRPDVVFTKGKGHYLFDASGTAYLDMMQGWAVNTLGHSPNFLKHALLNQAEQLINPGPAFYNKPMIELSNTLCSASVFDHVFFANSGAEANEGAIKLARKWGQLNKQGAFEIITFKNSFHGRTLATMSATGKASFAPLFEPKISGFKKVPFNDPQALINAISSNTTAIMLELVQGEAGVIPAEYDFVKKLETQCKQHNLLLIVDEVQTGVGRTGKLFAYQHYGISPDILTLGKGLGGGVPISALLAKQAVSCFAPGDQGGTFNGNPLMCASALAVLEALEAENILSNVNKMSELLQTEFFELSQKYGLGQIRGQGLLLAIDTGAYDAHQIAASAFRKQLLINAPRSNCIRLMPALNIGPEEIYKAMSVLEDCLSELS